MRSAWVSLEIECERAGGKPRMADIVATFVRAIGDGRVPPGARLPPVRALEVRYGISKNTVQAAYDELVARGLVESRAREGVFAVGVAEALTVERMPAPPLPVLRTPPPMSWRPDASMTWLSAVFVDPELLPRERLAECFRSVLSAPLKPFYEAQGHRGLREVIALRLRRRAIEASADNIIITSGSQQAIDLVARANLMRTVGLETPVYASGKQLFEGLDYRITPLPIDPFEPLDRALWEERLRRDRPSLVYLITSYHNPTGRSYDSDELAFILRLSHELGFGLFEDDWGSDMLSLSEYRPTLRALGGPNVLYCDSFTKKLLPSLRIGYLVAPTELIPSLVAAKRVATLGQAAIIEAALCEFLERGYYDTHLTKMQTELEARYLAALEILRTLFVDDDICFGTPGGGPTLWLELPESVDLARLRAYCHERRVAIEDASNHFVHEQPRSGVASGGEPIGMPHLHGFRVGYAFLPTAKLAAALEVVAAGVRALRA